MMRLALLLVILPACFRLDSFVYSRRTVDAYDFELDSDDPKEAITADRFEQFSIPVDDGQVAAVYVRAPAPASTYVIYFHGQGQLLDGALGRVKRLANLGVDVLAVNYRGFGTSTDMRPTEASVAADTKASVDYLRARAGAVARIVYYGRSFGTATATQRAIDDPPAALILESPIASLEAFKTDSSGFDFPIGFIADARWDTEHMIALVHTPVLVMHGLADDYVRHEFGERVFANANFPKQLILVPGADHSNVAETMGDAWDVAVTSLIRPGSR